MNINEMYYYPCQFEENAWVASMCITHVHDSYVSCNINSDGSYFEMHIGKYASSFWVCLPIQEKATTLSYLNDTFWNLEVLTSLLSSIPDAIALTNALKKLEGLLS